MPKAWQEFDGRGRMKPSPLRDRVVDVCEEFHKFTLVKNKKQKKTTPLGSPLLYTVLPYTVLLVRCCPPLPLYH